MAKKTERLPRFHALYRAVLKQGFDQEEFVADDLYAFQTLERAMRSGDQELRDLANQMQAQRQVVMQGMRLNSANALNTQRLDAVPAPPAHAVPPTASAVSGDAPTPAPQERRSGEVCLTPQEMTRVTYFQRLYRQEFGRPLNVTRFNLDDGYGRKILQQALQAANQDLVVVAKHFVDERGQLRLHRRGQTSMPLPGDAAAPKCD